MQSKNIVTHDCFQALEKMSLQVIKNLREGIGSRNLNMFQKKTKKTVFINKVFFIGFDLIIKTTLNQCFLETHELLKNFKLK